MTEVWLAFLAGLAGSPHCLGMCGGIVTALALNCRQEGGRGRLLFQLGYNLGRMGTYALLGVAAGFIGASLDVFLLKTLSAWVFAVANGFVMLVGLASVLGTHLNLFTLESSGGRFLAGPLRWAMAGSSPARSIPLGLILGFLPCGLIYAPLIAAATSGSPLRGGAVMAALGLGTLPVMLGFGSLATLFSVQLKGAVFRVAGLLVALIGFAGLWRVLGKLGHVPPFPLW